MEYKNKINELIKKHVRNILLNESLNNFSAPLYHNTSIENLSRIMSSDSINSGYHRGYNGEGVHNGICFTRSKSYNPYTYYNVRLTFDVDKLLRNSRGLKLVSYKDPEYEYLDEYEERLISKKGNPFTLTNISNVVTDVVIILDNICTEIIENGEDVDGYLDELKDIISNNIFGDKLKIIDNLKKRNIMSLTDACNYIISEVENGAYEPSSVSVYCVDYYDDEEDMWMHEEYTSNYGEAISVAKEMHEEDNIPTRVTYGIYDGIEYEQKSIVQIFN